jgi:acyl carrier protein
MQEQIRNILQLHGNLGTDATSLESETSLHQVGLTSHATVNLMLALEDHFGVEFPERMLRRRVFDSIATIEAALTELTTGPSATAPVAAGAVA